MNFKVVNYSIFKTHEKPQEYNEVFSKYSEAETYLVKKMKDDIIEELSSIDDRIFLLSIIVEIENFKKSINNGND